MDNFYMKSNFRDFNDMAEALHHWNLEIRQLEPGEINDTITQLQVNNINFGCAQFTGKTHQIGQIPPGRTFAFHRGEESKLLWRKKNVPHDSLMIFPMDSELDVVTKGKFNAPHTLSVSEDVLTARLSKSEKEIYRKIVSAQDLVLVDTVEMENFQAIFDKYFESVEENPELIHMENFQVCLEEEMLSALIATLFSKQDAEKAYVPSKSNPIWEKLENYMETHKYKAIRVSELSQMLEISERSLYRLFIERFDISPKAYLNKLRLNGVRLDITKSSNDETKISHIANKWGFWHMGQFAADYKQLFGELPSKTLEST